MDYVFVRAAISMALLWLSFPPVGLSVLAWFSLLPILHIAISNQPLTRLNYLQLYFAGLLYWLATFYFIPIPHPALWFGWIVISAYLACYLPVFVTSTRNIHQRFKIPFIAAAGISWTGLELIRNHLFTGMGLVSLSHSQFRNPRVIQICDLSGSYTLSFAIVFIAASGLVFFQFIKTRPRVAILNAVAGILVLGGIFWYGNERLNPSDAMQAKSLKVGLIQGNIDTNLMATAKDYQIFQKEKTAHYQQLNAAGIHQWDEVDLVVWPENGWPYPDLHPDTDRSKMAPDSILQYQYAHFDAVAKLFVSGKPTPTFLVGAVTYDPIKNDSYGSALLIDDQGIVQERYFKNHLVMFGEYIPLSDWLPLLNRIPAVGKGLMSGNEAVSIEVNDFRLTPSICFESTVPHFIRHQIASLTTIGEEPDVMVNLTNDGWFYGTSCLDFHLACNVFRAVEMRKPHLVCANTGLSAHIDDRGFIIAEGPRRETATILAHVDKSDITSTYLSVGDTVPMAFAGLTIVGLLWGFFGKSSFTPRSATPE